VGIGIPQTDALLVFSFISYSPKHNNALLVDVLHYGDPRLLRQRMARISKYREHGGPSIRGTQKVGNASGCKRRCHSATF
jgi:hypothetical protein